MLTLFIRNFRRIPIARSSFTPHGQNVKIPKIDFCDVITSVLYSDACKKLFDMRKMEGQREKLHIEVVQ